MNKLAGLFVAGALVVGGGVGAAIADPGPHHGNNKHGLCTAYFNGSETGMTNKRKAHPFVALVAAAEAANDTPDPNDTEATGEDAVREYCVGQIGGAPDRRG